MAVEDRNQGNLDALIWTGLDDPIAIRLAESLLQEAEIPYFVMEAIRRRAPFGGEWNIRVSADREAEVREILQSVQQTQ